MPKALGMSAAVMGALSLLPGMPMLPFLGLAAGAAYMARRIDAHAEDRRRGAAADAAAKPPRRRPRRRAKRPMAEVLKIDELKIEIGYALLPLVNSPDGTDRLTEQIKALRRTLASDLGFVMPSVRILDNVQLEANTYIVKLKEVDAGQGQVFPASSWRSIPWAGASSFPASTPSSRPSACPRPGSTPPCATRRRCAATRWWTPRR